MQLACIISYPTHKMQTNFITSKDQGTCQTSFQGLKGMVTKNNPHAKGLFTRGAMMPIPMEHVFYNKFSSPFFSTCGIMVSNKRFE
jgi:hypothetical protein